MASFWYTRAITKILQREATDAIDLDGDTIKVGLSTTVHVPNKDDTFANDGGADDFNDGEATGTGYAGGFGGAGRKALATKAVTNDLTNDRSKFDADDLTWTGYDPSAAAAQATVLKEITADTSSPLILNLDFADVDPAGNDFVLQFHVDGIGYIAT
jgi:hypothetical protein